MPSARGAGSAADVEDGTPGSLHRRSREVHYGGPKLSVELDAV